MRRIMLTVAYDGTDYCGWQKQPNGVTIEEKLNEAITNLTGVSTEVIGASRTDSGVHALGNVAVFDTEMAMPAEKFTFALNQRLPDDIRVQSSREVGPRWHPRKQNCIKTYQYGIYNSKVANPLVRRYTHYCYFNLDFEKMREAAGYLVGTHDFTSFCTVRTQATTTVRTVYSCDLYKDDEMITMQIRGDGFLYNMIRIIVGTLIKVGIGVYPPEHMVDIMKAKDRQKAGPTIEPCGLTLVDIEYESLIDEEND